MEQNIFKQLSERVENGEKAALAMVTAVGGSTPGKPGIMMAVFEDGSTIGTVGGGKIEFDTIAKARECMASGESKSYHFELEEQKTDIFIRAFNPKPKLVIVGAGHVAYELYKVAGTQNFEIHIVDNRDELCNKERFPEAQIHRGDILGSLRRYNIDENTYIVIAGPNHEIDEFALEAVLGREANYIGMLGSKKKFEKITEHVLERGGKLEQLEAVHTPVGINIGSNIPAELAIAIMAQIIIVKNSIASRSL